MTREVAEKIVSGITDKIECNTVDIDDWAEFWGFTVEEYEEFLDMAIKSLEQEKPMEKFENVKDHIYKLAGDYKCWDNRLTDDEALELCHILEQPASDDCVSRQAMLDAITKIDGGTNMDIYTNEVREIVKALPPVTPTLPKGATNGDMIRLIFGEEFEKKAWVFCSQSWWNAPYKEVEE